MLAKKRRGDKRSFVRDRSVPGKEGSEKKATTGRTPRPIVSKGECSQAWQMSRAIVSPAASSLPPAPTLEIPQDGLGLTKSFSVPLMWPSIPGHLLWNSLGRASVPEASCEIFPVDRHDRGHPDHVSRNRAANVVPLKEIHWFSHRGRNM